MAGDNLPPRCRDLGNFCAHPLVQRRKPRGIGFRIAAIKRFPGRVSGDQPSGDVADVVLAEPHILPGMRVRHLARPGTMIMPPPRTAMVMPMRFHQAWRDALGRGDHPPFEARGTDHAVQPAFKTKPVANDERCIGQRGGVRWLGLKAMRIHIRPGNGAERHAIPADLARHIRQDGEGSHHRGPLLGQGGPDQQQGGRAKQGAAKHGVGPSD